MTTDALVRKALDAGIELRLVDGRIKIVGKKTAVAEWVPRLQGFKRQIQAMLNDAKSIENRAMHQQYIEHHFNCPHCIAGSQGRGDRCFVGELLWFFYEGTAL